MKVCLICKVDKPLDDFWKHNRSKDGRKTICVKCTKERKNLSCLFEGCVNKIRCSGLCKTHSEQKRRTGILKPIKKNNGSGTIHRGYRIISKPGHLNSDSNGRIPEHRFVMSEHLGRPLYAFENVPHKNGNKLDNRLENLELWITKQPYGQRPEDLLVWANEIIKLYGPKPITVTSPYTITNTVPYVYFTNSGDTNVLSN